MERRELLQLVGVTGLALPVLGARLSAQSADQTAWCEHLVGAHYAGLPQRNNPYGYLVVMSQWGLCQTPPHVSAAPAPGKTPIGVAPEIRLPAAPWAKEDLWEATCLLRTTGAFRGTTSATLLAAMVPIAPRTADYDCVHNQEARCAQARHQQQVIRQQSMDMAMVAAIFTAGRGLAGYYPPLGGLVGPLSAAASIAATLAATLAYAAYQMELLVGQVCNSSLCV